MKIHYIYESDGDAWGIIASERNFKKNNIFFSFSKEMNIPKKIDALLIQSNVLQETYLNTNVPIFIRDKIDGAQLGSARKFINHKNVIKVFKGYCLSPGYLNNETSNRYFLEKRIPKEKIDYTKIVSGHGFGAYKRIVEKASQASLRKKRTLDVVFHGTTNYKKIIKISDHRKDAVKAIQKYSENKLCSYNKNLSHRKYMKTLEISFSCVSPFGYGEACYRDYEALMAGAVLIKPYMSHISCNPNIYIPGKTYIPCSSDFKDLEQCVQEAKQISNKQRVRNKQLALHGFSDLVNIYSRYLN